MPTFAECWERVYKLGYKHADGTEVLNRYDRDSMLEQVAERVRSGLDPLEAAKLTVQSHIDEMDGQLESVRQQLALPTQEAAIIAPQPALVAPQSPLVAAEPEEEATPKPIRRIASGRPWDLIDELQANLKGRLSLSKARKFIEYFKPTGALRKIFSNEKDAYAPDIGAQVVSHIREFESEESFLEALEAAAEARKGFVKQGALEKRLLAEQSQQAKQFEKKVIEGKRPETKAKNIVKVPVQDVLEGDTFQVQNQEFEVESLEIDEDGRLLSLTVKDGLKFGVQTIDPSRTEFIHVDKDTYKSVPLTGFESVEESGPHPILDEIDFEGTVLAPTTTTKGRLGVGKGKKKEPVETEEQDEIEIEEAPAETETAATLGAAFMEVTDQQFSTDLGERLTSEARSTQGLNTETNRVTFFEDQETGEVIGLPTYYTKSKARGGKIYRVAALPGEAKGTSLEKLMAGERYVPVASVRRKTPISATDPKQVVRFRDYEDFQARLVDPAKERLAAMAGYVPSQEQKMQAGYVAETGEVIETISEGSFTPNDLAQDFAEMVVDILPKSGSAISRNLTVVTLRDLLRNAFEAGDTRPTVLWGLRQVAQKYVRDPVFRRLTPTEKERVLIEDLARAIYEVYTPIIRETDRVSGFTERLVLAVRRGSGQEVLGRTGEPTAAAGSQASIAGAGLAIRFRSGGFASGETVRERYNQVLSTLAAAGVDVQVFQRRIDTLAGDFFRNSGSGLYEESANLVALVASDVTNPTRDDLVAALHETVHFLYSKESPEMQARLHRAVEAMRFGRLQSPATGDRLIDSEERLAEGLAQEGVERNLARNLAAAIWRLLRELYLRAAIAIQEGLFGEGHSRPDLAVEYMRNRLDRFLAGDNRYTSFISTLGGGFPTLAETARVFRPVNGGGWVEEFYNWETNRIEYEPVVPTTVQAALWNLNRVLYRSPTYTADREELGGEDNPSLRAGIDISALNESQAVLDRLYRAYGAAGANIGNLNFQQFAERVLDLPGDLPLVVVQAITDELQAKGLPPADIALSISGPNQLQSEALRAQATAKAIRRLNEVRSHMDSHATEAQRNITSTNNRLQKRITREQELHKRYTDLDFIYSETLVAINDLFAEFRIDMREQRNIGWKLGQLTQQVRNLENREVDPQYAATLERMAKQIVGQRVRFMDVLSAAANVTGIDWVNDGMAEINAKIKAAAATKPVLAPLTHDTQDSRALLAIVGAFAKQNAHVMVFLRLRLSTEKAELATVNLMLKAIMQDSSDDLRQARAYLRQIPKLAAEANRLLMAYQKIKAENRTLLNALKADQDFLLAHGATYNTLRGELARLEQGIGAGAGWEPTHKAKMFLPPSPKATIAETEANQVEFTFDAGPQQIRSWINSMEMWLGNQAERGALWHTVSDQARKLNFIPIQNLYIGLRKGFIATWIGSSSTQLGLSGSPSARDARSRLKRFDALKDAHTEHNVIKSTAVTKAKGDAMAALGIRQQDFFNQMFRDRALKYIESRKDILEAPDAQNRILLALKAYLTSDPDTRDFVGRPGAWTALDAYYRKMAEANRQLNKTRGEMGIKIKDDVLGLFREPIGDSAFTFMRGLSSGMVNTWNTMKGDWNGTRLPRLTAALVAEEYQANPQQLQARLQSMFSGDTWQHFIKPMAQMPSRALFSGPKLADGTWPIANTQNVKEAFRLASGDPIAFALELYRLEGGTQGGEAEFVGETLETFQNYFDAINRIMADRDEVKRRGIEITNTPHQLMDARVSESFPTEWLEYFDFNQNDARNIVHQLAYHAAFGRDGESIFADFDTAIKELDNAVKAYEAIKQDVILRNPGKSQKALNNLIRSEIVSRGGRDLLIKYENAASHLRQVRRTENSFRELMSADNPTLYEMRPFQEALSVVSGVMVQGVKTAITNTISMFDVLVRSPLSRAALRQVRHNWSAFIRGVFGSFIEPFGHTIYANSSMTVRRLENGVIYSNSRTLMLDRLKAIGTQDRIIPRIARGAREVLQAPVPSLTPPEQRAYPQLRPLSPFTWVNQLMDPAIIEGTWRRYDDLVLRAVNYFKANPNAIAQADFQFTPEMLDLKNGVFMQDADEFRYAVAMLSEYGMTLEGLAREALNRNNGVLLTKEQDQLLAAMALHEISLHSSSSTLPLWASRPGVRWMMPLLSWPIARLDQMRKAFREPNGEASLWAMQNGLKMLAVILPIGFAMAWLRDEIDEWMLGKKSDIRGFGESNLATAAVERIARVGTLGIWGDVANSAVNLAGEGDMRGISLDNRIVMVNAFHGLERAFNAWIRQGEATYQTVYRPILMAVGGSGLMQHWQLINHALDLDNIESRVSSRINVRNYLRAAGRELNMDVITGRAGQASLPNSIKPWIGEMALAAYADDMAAFQEARQKAVQAARDENKPEPIDHVKRSFSAYHPLKNVFRTWPSEAEYRQILNILPEDGRKDVTEAVTLFNRYAGLLDIKEFTGKQERPSTTNRMTIIKPLTLDQIRDRSLLKLQRQSIFSGN